MSESNEVWKEINVAGATSIKLRNSIACAGIAFENLAYDTRTLGRLMQNIDRRERNRINNFRQMKIIA